MDVYYFYNGITNIISFASRPTIINENNLISLIDDRFNKKVNKTINGGFLIGKKGKKKKNDETENDKKDSEGKDGEDENNVKDNEGKDNEEENDEKDNEGKDGEEENDEKEEKGKSKFSKFKDGLSGLKDGLSGAVSTIRAEDEDDEDSMSTTDKIKYLLSIFMKIIVFVMFMFLLPIAPFVALSYYSYIRLKKYYEENMYTL